MTTAAAAKQGRSELGVALLLVVLAGVVAVDASQLSAGIGRTGPIGPGVVPTIVAAALAVTGVLLAVDVLRGGRGEPEGGEDIDLTGGSDWRTVLLLAAAFLANAALIDRVGWPVSGAVLFFGAAYALGSRHYIRDAVLAVVLSVGSWYLFVLGLGIALPVGILRGIL